MSLNHQTLFMPLQQFPGLNPALYKLLFPVFSLTLMRTSSLCIQLLWFWKRFSSFQMFSSRSAWADASPRVCWSSRERSDIRVTFSISTSSRREDTWDRETGEWTRHRVRDLVWVMTHWSLSYSKSPQIEYRLLSITTVSLVLAKVLNQSRCWFSCLHLIWLSIFT